MASVKSFLARCPSPPPAPAAALRAITVIQSGDYTMRELEKIVRADEGLSARLLTVVNSAAFGVSGRTFDLGQALVRLGSRNVAKVILEQSTRSLFTGAEESYGVRREQLWRGAIGGAIAAELTAQRTKTVDPSLAYVCALLRDIGKLVIEITYGASAARMMNGASGSTCQLERERTAFGIDHAELGAGLAEAWKLPQPIPDAIRFHHEPPAPEDPRHSDLFDVVHAADVICLWAGLAIGTVDGLEYRLASHVQQRLHLHVHDAESEIVETWSRVNEIEELLAGSPTG